MGFRRIFLSAVAAYVDTVAKAASVPWDSPALGEWTVAELIGHAAGSGLGCVPTVLRTPAARRTIATPQDYFALARSVPPETLAAARAASTALGRRDATALGDDPGAAVRAMANAAEAALAEVSDDDIVESAAGGMRVVDWLPTRTFELVVHGLDISAATGIAFQPSGAALADATALAARLAVAAGDGVVVLRALTGRGGLPAGYAVG
jgi:hypothetical protein